MKMNLYKVEFKGYAYVEAEDEEEAKFAFELDEFEYREKSICNVTEKGTLDMYHDMEKGLD